MTTLEIFTIVAAPCMASFGLLLGDRWESQLTTRAYLRSCAISPSHCDGCGKQISPLYLVPIVGWIIARGRSSCCGKPIPFHLVAGELAALVFALTLVAIRADAIYFLPAIAGAAASARSDWRVLEVHESASILIALSGVLLAFAGRDWTAHAISAAAVTLAFVVTYGFAAWRGILPTFPMGDLFLIAACGATLTPDALPIFVVTLALPAIAATGIEALPATRSSSAPALPNTPLVPFAPILVAATAAALVLPQVKVF